MGAAAGRGTAGDAVAPVDSPVRRAVLQPRMPAMTEKQIRLKPDVAQELLLHRLRTMPNAEYEELRNNPLVASIAELEGQLRVDQLVAMYPVVFAGTTEATRYELEPGASHEPSQEHAEKIIEQLKPIFTAIGNTRGNDPALMKIFGVDAEGLERVKDVFTKARTLLASHGKQQTCPVLALGNAAHNAWVGVAGMTSKGQPRVDLGASSIAELAAGRPEGAAALLHELTHAAAGTDDHAYGLTAMAKLGPAKRVENASHYEHAYLETVVGPNPSRYYDAQVSIGQQAANETQQSALRKKKAKAAMGLAAEMWNALDNCYGAAQQPVEAKASNVDIDDIKVQFGDSLRDLGVFPHNQTKPKMTGNVALALIEDRTRYLNELKKIDVLRRHILQVSGDELAQLEPTEFLASIIAKQLRLHPDVAAQWVYYLLHLTEWLQANQ